MWSEEITEKIQTTAKSLLEQGKVELIIGYQAGSLPWRTSPAFIRSPEEASLLVWNPFCENNLSVYLDGKKEKIALLAKGCDARAAIVALQEKRIDRDRLTIIALPCSGIVDRRKLTTKGEKGEIYGRAGYYPEGGDLILKGEKEMRVALEDVLHASCKGCSQRVAPKADIFIGQETFQPPKIEDEFAEVRAFEALSHEERWQYFLDLASKCIRCYACRQACPLCYCKECIVDQTQPQWFGKTTAEEDVLAYHIMRAVHIAGRCVDCGACNRACPIGLDLRLLNKKLQKDVQELYNYTSGLDPEALPVLGAYNLNDPQGCITEK